MERRGAFSGGADTEYVSNQLPDLNTDGSGSMRGNGDNDDDGDGEGRCVFGDTPSDIIRQIYRASQCQNYWTETTSGQVIMWLHSEHVARQAVLS